MTTYARSVPGPFKTVEDAEGEIVAFIGKLHETLDDELLDFAEQFVTRSHPEASQVITDLMTAGSSTDAIENSPEYQLFYSEISDVIQHVLQKFAADWRPNIYGHIQWRIQQRERAMEGAPE